MSPDERRQDALRAIAGHTIEARRTGDTAAEGLARAGVWASGGVSAYLIPAQAAADSEALRDALREGCDLSQLGAAAGDLTDVSVFGVL